MAGTDCSFSSWDELPDDSKFVFEAMAQLGFVGYFSDLPIADMHLILALALHLKRTQGRPEMWES